MDGLLYAREQHNSGTVLDPRGIADLTMVTAWRMRQQGELTGWDISYDGSTFYVAVESTGAFADSGSTCALLFGAGSGVNIVMNAGVARFARALIENP